MYTDGLIEARDEIGDTFGMERLTHCFMEHGKEPAPNVASSIMASQEAFRGSQPCGDDVTLVVAELTGP
jgi:sigma-B regulation protein RsbU (phosphoserine phosphatase)